MFSYISDLRENFRIVDLLDIAIISVFVYFGMVWLRHRASRAVLVALVLTLFLYGLSTELQLYLTSSLFQLGLAFIVLSLVLIFQDDFRRAFERIASWGGSREVRQSAGHSEIIDVLVETATKLALEGIGALIVVRGRESLERHARGGVTLRGRLSLPLLQSIFDPHSPGHDGAVMIVGDRIEKFSVHLPLSVDQKQPNAYGTRHAAALGLCELSDAFVIAVSEERRTISVAQNGHLECLENTSQLKARLESFYAQLFPSLRPASVWKRALRNPGTKLAAVVTAALLWLVFANRVERIERTYDVPIEYRNLAPQFALGENLPADARVTLSGSEREFSMLQPAALRISLDLGHLRDGVARLPITEENVSEAKTLDVMQIRPDEARIEVYHTATVQLRVSPRTVGSLQAPLALEDTTVNPSTVPIVLRWMGTDRQTSISTQPIDLGTIRQTQTVRVALDLPAEARMARDTPEQVLVTIRVKVENSPTPQASATH